MSIEQFQILMNTLTGVSENAAWVAITYILFTEILPFILWLTFFTLVYITIKRIWSEITLLNSLDTMLRTSSPADILQKIAKLKAEHELYRDAYDQIIKTHRILHPSYLDDTERRMRAMTDIHTFVKANTPTQSDPRIVGNRGTRV